MTALDRPLDRHGTPLPVRVPAAGVGCQLVLLTALGAGVGLHPVGWAAGTAYAVVLSALLTRALLRSGARSPGPADWVTLARAELVGGVTALVAAGWAGRAVPVALLVALAAVALVLDAVDGRVARRTGTVSRLGARFDMEVDAFLILVLSVHVAGSVGVWAPVIGAMRYVFVAAAWGAPWLRAPLPPSLARKGVAAVQGIVLVVAGAGVAPGPVAVGLVASALAALVWSFGRDVGWLRRNRADRSGTASARSVDHAEARLSRAPHDVPPAGRAGSHRAGAALGAGPSFEAGRAGRS